MPRTWGLSRIWRYMKVCKRCNTEKDESEFNKSKSRADGLNHWCRTCHRASVNDHYLRNRPRLIVSKSKDKSKRRDAIRHKIHEYLQSHPCVDCGEADPVVLEFDHVRGVKSFAISNRAYRVVPAWEHLMIEIDKCDVRCANCHRRKTSKQLNWHASRTSIDVQFTDKGGSSLSI